MCCVFCMHTVYLFVWFNACVRVCQWIGIGNRSDRVVCNTRTSVVFHLRTNARLSVAQRDFQRKSKTCEAVPCWLSQNVTSKIRVCIFIYNCSSLCSGPQLVKPQTQTYTDAHTAGRSSKINAHHDTHNSL